MFIQTEDTPNPSTLKFLPGQPVAPMGPYNYTTKEDASASPLAIRLFGIEGVQAVFLGEDFITVTKDSDSEWDFLKALCLSGIMEHYVSGMAVVDDDDAPSSLDIDEDDDEVVKQIKELLAMRVRPAVAQDGGDIIFNKFEDGVLFLEMHGACAGCPSSTVTLKNGIENMMKHYVPEVKEVRSTTEEEPVPQHYSVI